MKFTAIEANKAANNRQEEISCKIDEAIEQLIKESARRGRYFTNITLEFLSERCNEKLAQVDMMQAQKRLRDLGYKAAYNQSINILDISWRDVGEQ